MNTPKMRTAIALFAFLFSVITSSMAHAAATWTELAKKVGESEDNRVSVIAQLRKVPALKAKLQKAIYTQNRPLALDVISALEMKELIPDLLLHVPADPDGFLTVAINAMMDPKNQTLILNSYTESLAVSELPKMSSAAIVAMLEPVGRLAVVLARETLLALRDNRSPEVRSSLIYYLRIMAIRNHKFENLDMLSSLLKAAEFQIRLQVISVSSEILVSGAHTGLPSRSDMKSVCESEKTASIKAACLSFLAITPRVPASVQAPMCLTMEKSLYAKNTLKIRMIFGYKDARPARFVGDRHERLAFIERISATCDSHSKEPCGFIRSHDNADLFMKKLKIKGKDRRVLLWVVNSSVGTDDQENRDDPFQRWKSKYAEDAFLTGLSNADVVMYDGHSRFGGGPDFGSPKLAADGTVDPSSYQTDRPGLTKMITALKDSRKGSASAKANPFSRLKVLGLFSCSSSQHFTEEIHDVSKTGVVSSKVLMYYSDALRESISTLGDVLSGQCPRTISF